MTTASPETRNATPTPQMGERLGRPTTLLASLAALLLAAFIFTTYGWRQASLFLVGLLAGTALYHAAFGFTGAWRRMITERRSAGLRAAK